MGLYIHRPILGLDGELDGVIHQVDDQLDESVGIDPYQGTIGPHTRLQSEFEIGALSLRATLARMPSSRVSMAIELRLSSRALRFIRASCSTFSISHDNRAGGCFFALSLSGTHHKGLKRIAKHSGGFA